jgi:hypothetical protein
MPHPRLEDGQPEGEGELGAVIGLDLLDRKGQSPAEFREKLQTGARVELGVEAEHPVPGAIVTGGVLVRLRPVHGDHLHVDLDGLAGRGFFEELELPWRLNRPGFSGELVT